MIPKHNDGSAYDHWARGGGSVKARFSNTTVRYGTQVLDLPVLASNTGRMVPEYFTGTLLTSHEIKNLEVVAGKLLKTKCLTKSIPMRMLLAEVLTVQLFGVLNISLMIT